MNRKININLKQENIDYSSTVCKYLKYDLLVKLLVVPGLK